MLSPEKLTKVNNFRQEFDAALADDLNLPQTLAILWQVVKSNIPNRDKYDLLIEFDQVWGLNLNRMTGGSAELVVTDLEAEIQALIKKREDFRRAGKFTEADQIRDQLNKQGIVIEDSTTGLKIKRKV